MAQKTEKTPSSVSKNMPQQPGRLMEFVEYLRESRVELKKVVWPVRKEVTATTIAVLALVVVMVLYLGAVDFGLAKVIQFILS